MQGTVRLRAIAASILGAVFVLSVTQARADEIRVLAAGVYETSVTDLAQSFKRETGHEARLTFANAGTIAAKLEAGEAFDVVMSSSKSLDALAAKGLVIANTKREIGRMRLGVAIKAGQPPIDVSSIDALRRALGSARSISYPDPKRGGTSGVHIATMMERLGIADQMQAKYVVSATGADIVNGIRHDQISLGITQISELKQVEGAQFIGPLPEELELVTPYAAAIGAHAQASDAAEVFLRYIKGPAGADRLVKAGFDLVAKP